MEDNRIKLEKLEKEIRRLQAERKRLETIKELKLKKLSIALGNIPKKIQAEHPIVTEAVITTGHGLKKVGSAIGGYMAWAKEHPNEGWVGYIREKKRIKEGRKRVLV